MEQRIIEKLAQCPIYNKVEGWIIEYPEFDKLADEQADVFWPWHEPEVANDVQDLRVHLTEAEYKGVVDILKLFTSYEMHVGDDYWAGRIAKRFKRPEIARMAYMNAAVEYNSHAPFYNEINKLLFLDTEEFYSSWKEDPILCERMSFIEQYARSPNDLLSLAAFVFLEGAVLYSSFAFLKHFQSQECGKDLIKNICSGVGFSVADEHAHAVGGAALFRRLIMEADLTEKEMSWVKEHVYLIAQEVIKHENAICDMIFSHGDIKGIKVGQLKSFVVHRVNLCLEMIGMDEAIETEFKDDFIEKWFYKDINSIQFHDFFVRVGNEYNISWKETKFGEVWT